MGGGSRRGSGELRQSCGFVAAVACSRALSGLLRRTGLGAFGVVRLSPGLRAPKTRRRLVAVHRAHTHRGTGGSCARTLPPSRGRIASAGSRGNRTRPRATRRPRGRRSGMRLSLSSGPHSYGDTPRTRQRAARRRDGRCRAVPRSPSHDGRDRARRPLSVRIVRGQAASGSVPRGPGWLFEPKMDGFRCLVCTHGRLFARSRRGWDMTTLVFELGALPAGVQPDGELGPGGDPNARAPTPSGPTFTVRIRETLAWMPLQPCPEALTARGRDVGQRGRVATLRRRRPRRPSRPQLLRGTSGASEPRRVRTAPPAWRRSARSTRPDLRASVSGSPSGASSRRRAGCRAQVPS